MAPLATNFTGVPPVVPKFAGRPIEKEFKSITLDEGEGTREVDLEYYMYRSSNYYNAVMAYFGMLTPRQLDSLWDESLFKRATYNSQESYQNVFPVMRIAERPERNTAFNYFVSESNYLNHDALLPSGLEHFFGLPSSNVRTMGLYASIPRFVRVGGKVKSKSSAFTNTSFFNVDMRAKMPAEPRQRNEYGVRSVALGTNSAWAVSPVKMAEMFGRMITLNSGYALTLDPNEKPERTPFFSELEIPAYLAERAPLIRGMSYVFRTGNPSGTAVSVYTSAIRQQGVYLDSDRDTGYYIYGKTGTIDGKLIRESLNGNSERYKSQDHLLSVIITNRRISTIEDFDQLKDVKFVVVYFVDSNYSSWKDIDSAILDQIIRSESFNRYMNN